MSKYILLSLFALLTVCKLSTSLPIQSDLDTIFHLNHRNSPTASLNLNSGRHEKSKRSTMLLNKLMNAFQKTNMENGLDGADFDNGENGLAQPLTLPENFKFDPAEFARTGGGGGGGGPDGDKKMFWRCYFNAVSCF